MTKPDQDKAKSKGDKSVKEDPESNIDVEDNRSENKDQNNLSKYEHLYTYCEQCREHIFMNYEKSMVTNARSYPVYYVWIHGKPLHGLLVRIDKNFVSRGERIVNLGFDLSSLQENL